jgi:hypothetical protein
MPVNYDRFSLAKFDFRAAQEKNDRGIIKMNFVEDGSIYHFVNCSPGSVDFQIDYDLSSRS